MVEMVTLVSLVRSWCLSSRVQYLWGTENWTDTMCQCYRKPNTESQCSCSWKNKSKIRLIDVCKLCVKPQLICPLNPFFQKLRKYLYLLICIIRSGLWICFTDRGQSSWRCTCFIMLSCTGALLVHMVFLCFACVVIMNFRSKAELRLD